MKKKTSEDLIEKLLNLPKMSDRLSRKKMTPYGILQFHHFIQSE